VSKPGNDDAVPWRRKLTSEQELFDLDMIPEWIEGGLKLTERDGFRASANDTLWFIEAEIRRHILYPGGLSPTAFLI